METLEKSGGARIGWLNVSWPFGGIEVAPGRITVRGFGRYDFTPGDVTSVEEVGLLPLITRSHQIHHTNPDYPETIRFISLGGYRELTAAIRQAGFRVGKPVDRVSRGFPLRIPAVVAIVVLWNALLLLDRLFAIPRSQPGPYATVALAVVLVLATLLPRSALLQRWFLREGRRVSEIKPFLGLLQIVSGFMLVMFLME